MHKDDERDWFGLLSLTRAFKASIVTSGVFRSRIAIVQIIEEDILRPAYGSAIMSVACYARAQGYEHFILVDKMFFAKCLHKNKFFLHHCIVAYVLRNYDYVLYLDVNIGVVNPKRRIEDYIDEDLDLIFFERMANWGLTTETYLARNSQRAQNLLNGLANYESRVPARLHGKPSAIIHEYLAGWFPPANSLALSACRRIHSKRFLTKRDDLLYQACLRRVLNPYNRYLVGSVKILPKGSGWARESWSTNSKWNDQGDFMLFYGSDSDVIMNPQAPVPLGSTPKATWYNPLGGPIDIMRCKSGNTTWSYDLTLIADEHDLNRYLQSVIDRYEKDYSEAIKYIEKFLQGPS